MIAYEQLTKRLETTNSRIAATKDLIALASTNGLRLASINNHAQLGVTRDEDREDPHTQAFIARMVSALKDHEAYLKDERLKIVFDLTNVAKLEMGG